MLRQPNVIEAVLFAPDDLVEDLAVEAVGGLTPLNRSPEVRSRGFYGVHLLRDLPNDRRAFSTHSWPRTSDLSRAAVHEEFDAGDVGAVVGGEKYRRLAEIVGHTQPCERDGGGGRGLYVIGHKLSNPGGVRVSGAQYIDPDVPPFEIDDPGAGERAHGRL